MLLQGFRAGFEFGELFLKMSRRKKFQNIEIQVEPDKRPMEAD